MSFDKEKKDILNNTNLWNRILSINRQYESYKFNSINEGIFKTYYKNTKKSILIHGIVLDGSFDFEGFLTGQIYKIKSIFSGIINKYTDLWMVYCEYKKKVQDIFDSYRLFKSRSDCPRDTRNVIRKYFGLSEWERYYELSKFEESHYESIIFQPHFPTILLVLNQRKDGTHGQNHYYNFGEIIVSYKKASEKIGRSKYIQLQRAIMSDDLRYDVLKRDGYRCQICGASAKDDVKLEVDHIIPLAKGGETTMDNLQTLCERCNRGKRTKDM